jgi:methionyl-tRNA synthetase
MIKNNQQEKAMALVSLIVNILAKASLLLHSVMPHKISLLAKSLGFEISNKNYTKLLLEKNLLDDVTIIKIDALFPRIETQLTKINNDKTTINKDDKNKVNIITIDKFFETSLKIGTIAEAQEIPKSKKLLQLKIDLGEKQKRQIVAGIKEYYNTKELIGTQVCVVSNLKSTKIMGFESQGMILAASDNNGLSLIRPEKSKLNGTKIS